jgi:hypothetical protein
LPLGAIGFDIRDRAAHAGEIHGKDEGGFIEDVGVR